ncbi:MAG: Nif3-like dinuclear metal center hexameric protein [Clostridiales Family XIII bacterium]|jgi:dinuclear metal center YbgI/SA1388 family protein|nr:Nif3-like dinuclear metal center hexameric protein [Clostridiales Family XIII bacterium]
MIAVDKLVAEIEKSAPLACMEPWDNSGWQIRLLAEGAGVSRVLVALELSGDVCAEAEALVPGLVLVHHPLFFEPLKAIDALDVNGGYAARLVRAGISVYAAHTSFDAAPGGMNDCLAARMGLSEVLPFPAAGGVGGGQSSAAGPHPMARSGRFAEPVAFGTLCRRVSEALARDAGGRAPVLRTVGDPGRLCRTGAVCGGAGGDFVGAAADAGLDVFLTSDVKHHQAALARERGLCLIDGGHFGTENLFTHEMAARLAAAFGGQLEVLETAADLDPWG